MNSQRRFERPELYLAWFTVLTGVLNLNSAAALAVVSRMEIISRIFPFEVRAGTRLATAFIGFILLLLASGVSRRKRVTWLISLPTLIISSVFHLIKGLDYEAAIVSVILIVLLIVFRKRFTAKSDPPTLRRGLTVLGIAIVFVLLYGTPGLYFLERHLPTPYQPGQALSQTLAMFFEFKPPTLVPLTRYGKFFVNSIYVLGIVVIGYALYAILSPVILREESRDLERENAEKIIREHGRTVLARFCLFKDKKYFFSSGGSVISFTTNRGVAIVLGDPIGPAEDARAAISEFRDFCVTNDWLPAFYQTLPDYLEDYKAAGLRALKIGEEAIVKLSDFQLAGGEMKSVRTSFNTAYNYKGLHAFKQKFNPNWEPRTLIHPGVQNLPAVALAISAVSS